jgi:hypothetical protein
MLATLIIWLSVTVAVLALIDLFLSKAQKTWLSNAMVKVWNCLDEAQGWSFADWLKEPRAKWWFAITLGLAFGISEAYFVFAWNDLIDEFRARRGKEPLALGVRGRLFAAAFTLAWFWIFIFYLTRPIFAWLLQFSSARHLSAKVVISFLGASAALYLSTFFLDDLLLWSGVYHAIARILFGLVGLLSLLCLCAATIFLSIGMAYVVSALLYVGEFLVRSIAEYPKGPVLALSALFGGIAALLKAFGTGS